MKKDVIKEGEFMVYKDVNGTYFYQFQQEGVTYKRRGFESRLECINAVYDLKNSLDPFFSEKENNICIDWLTFTFIQPETDKKENTDEYGNNEVGEKMSSRKDERDFITFLQPLLELLYLDSTKYDNLEFNRNGYKNIFIFDENTFVYYNNPSAKDNFDNMIACFEMSGSACRLFEERLIRNNIDVNFGYYFLFCFFREHNFKPTRIDIAYDDFQGIINFSELESKIDREIYICSNQCYKITNSRKKKGDPKGRTIDIGSVNSELSLCIYDKKVEQESHKGTFTGRESWVRYEMRVRAETAFTLLCFLTGTIKDLDDKNTILDNKANAVEIDNPLKESAKGYTKKLHLLGFNLKDFMKDYLFSYIDIKEESKDSNLSRRETWFKWVYLKQAVERVKLKNQAKLESTQKQKRKWFCHSMPRFTLKFLIEEYLKSKTITVDRFTATCILIWFKENSLDNKDKSAISNACNGTEVTQEIINTVQRLIEDALFGEPLEEVSKEYGLTD
ncbi:MAG: replication initiation factor domain-containing protein [Bacillales bacterium]|nr:replication initiation factor domain-containing protein [Bacillales bacterium]